MTHSEYRLLLKTDRTKAQRALFNEYLNYVYAIAYNCLHSCVSREDIGDCVLDVFMDVFSFYDEKCDLSGDVKALSALSLSERLLITIVSCAETVSEFLWTNTQKLYLLTKI